jgi:hypothetical protein
MSFHAGGGTDGQFFSWVAGLGMYTTVVLSGSLYKYPVTPFELTIFGVMLSLFQFHLFNF